MIIQVSNVPAGTLGIYPFVGGKPNRTTQGRMPSRTLFLHPEAAKNLPPSVRWSDLFRSPAASLQAMQEKSGVKAPGYSGHNFGYSGDVDVTDTMDRLQIGTKAGLDEYMAGFGWYCYRDDHRMEAECWHYNYFTEVEVSSYQVATTRGDREIEAKILGSHALDFRLTNEQAQTALKTLRLYDGKIDGDFGARSLNAVRIFQRAWGLKELGILDQRTMRTLAVVTATVEVV